MGDIKLVISNIDGDCEKTNILISFLIVVLYLLLCYRLSPSIVTYSNKYLSSHSFCGLGIWGWTAGQL